MDELTDDQKERLRLALLEIKRALEIMVVATRKGAAPVDLDEPIGRLSRMEAIQQANLASSNRDASERRLRLVSAALSRLTDVLEDYGLCVVCDEGIGYPRLKARPEATMCVACQSSREQSVAATRR